MCQCFFYHFEMSQVFLVICTAKINNSFFLPCFRTNVCGEFATVAELLHIYAEQARSSRSRLHLLPCNIMGIRRRTPVVTKIYEKDLMYGHLGVAPTPASWPHHSCPRRAVTLRVEANASGLTWRIRSPSTASYTTMYSCYISIYSTMTLAISPYLHNRGLVFF